ncbi:scm-like with four MBT domains protein 2 [Neocloeon triangulifer]|uniref:scm-like with four MBT domains protein 2 n=1 Tax=Neocloeon triangulifer TaxID=2078957 RepID=UPI00286EEDB1|nr:scm-like with four MBT domains protein 2 [Neocloeon triangulifer]XP_059484925.1 scm-like with four MBT domains protein 2 [Neocloeon triangulifer]XP_059484926.1 scm-like with four MBT domains protein 2 [Neocloeon triangulifer]XP_059484927.1 scm-like with four MBT domains protein 2 [Neocloeon triangulifer]
MTLFVEDADDAFVWQDYLEVTNEEEVPHALFHHVELSMESSLQPGLILEVADKNDKNKYWPATIKMNCGALLSMSYIGPKKTRMPEFWVDITKVDVRPLGWCKQQKEADPESKVFLDPPSTMKESYPDEDWHLLNSTATTGKQTVASECLSSEGHTPIERLRKGMRVEVQDEHNPYFHWIATIIDNVGGRLHLRYDVPESFSAENPVPDFWLFYLSPRLFKVGWADEKGAPFRYEPPSITSAALDDEGGWGTILESCKQESKKLPSPADLFEGEREMDSHSTLGETLFKEGMKLETVNPQNHVEICPATVINVYHTGHFTIQVDSISGTEMPPIRVSYPEDPYIFYAGWSKSNKISLTPPNGWVSEKEDFDWDEYLTTTMSEAVPKECFVKKEETAADMGFEVGQKLESIDIENDQTICAATITKILGHLLWVHLDCYENLKPSIIVSADSMDIFPVGWCGSNGYPLKPPMDHLEVCRKIKLEEEELPAPKTSETTSAKSSWCPKIYFNHKCFTGPYLSKGKIALLPKFVGPGPITLVLKEVLSQLISTAYKSRQVLKELTCEGKVPANMHIEMLKAKLKTAIFSANVAIATSADQVEEYCKSVCQKLQSCPYLFGPDCNDGHCPVGCSTLSKSQFTSYWSKKTKTGVPIDGTRKRGRKRKVKLLKDEDVAENGKDDESDQSSHGDAEYKERPAKKIFPAFEMRTRKAKLPNFALLGSSWVWGNDGADDQTPARKRRRGPSTDSVQLPTPPSSVKNMEGVVRKRGRPRIDRSQHRTAATAGLTNPAMWSKEDVAKYLKKTHDCCCLAERLEAEDIDGKAFMMLNLPTLLENFKFTIRYSIKLCQHIELVKYAYLTEYCK